MKEGHIMRLKLLATCMLSSFLLFGCNDAVNNEGYDYSNSHNETAIVKHEAVLLPVAIFVNSDYDKFAGTTITFTRSINNVNIHDFDESEKASFTKKYGSVFDGYNIDFSKYKKLTISASHQFEGKDNYEGFESFILDGSTVFVTGDYELIANEIVNKQLHYLSTDYKVGSSFEQAHMIEIAIPNEFVNDNLQLKTIQQLDEQINEIYINLVDDK